MPTKKSKPIRVLIVNSYEYPFNLLADSSFILTRSIIQALPAKEFYFIWVLPDLNQAIPHNYRASSTLDLPDNVSVLQVPMLRFRPLSELLLSEELFFQINPVNGKRCDYDIVFTNNPNIAGKLSDWFASVLYKNIHDYVPTDPPIVLVDYSTPFYGNDCECGYAKYYPSKLKSMYLGYTCADRSFFFTQYCFNKARDQFQKFYSAAESREFITKKAKMFYGIFRKDGLPKGPFQKRDEFSIYWGGRLAYGKRVKLMCQLVNKLYITGRKVKMVLTLPDTKSAASFKETLPSEFGDIFEIYSGLSQKEAFQIMSSCHASIFAQSMRFGPAAPLEQLATGLVVLPFKKESYDILKYDYPYYWGDKETLLAHLISIYDNYSEAVEKIKPFCNSIANTRSIEANVSELSFEMKNLVESQDNRIINEILPSTALLRGRIDEVLYHIKNGAMSYQEYTEWLLKNHRVYSPLVREMSPFYLNPSLWLLYKVLRSSLFVKLLRDDPVFHLKGEDSGT